MCWNVFCNDILGTLSASEKVNSRSYLLDFVVLAENTSFYEFILYFRPWKCPRNAHFNTRFGKKWKKKKHLPSLHLYLIYKSFIHQIWFDLREEKWDFLNWNWPGGPELWNRDCGIGGSGGRTPSQILADQLTLSQRGGLYPHISAPPRFSDLAPSLSRMLELFHFTYVIRCPKY